ncbi:MFS transporter [Planococcus halotolerans]|uniref:MFS transporter n=1 Tax=Planococcus halotolerans TaxID=2233542 RepID=UPI00109267DA|nr:MFS transporter [Planococcus halotolerans]QHJ70075.1 MFS transporter [Planococcus halotolerans]
MWKIVLPGISMIGVTYAFARYSFGLFLPDISSDLDLSESQAGYVGSAAYIAYTAALITASIFISKSGARHMVLLSGVTALLGMVGMAVSPNFIVLLLSAFIAGLGSGWISPAFSQIVVQSLIPVLQDKGNTWINTGTSVGIILTGPAALLFSEQWRLAYILFAVLAFGSVWWNAAALTNKIQGSSPPARLELRTKLLLNARFLIFASIGIGFASSIYWTFSRSYVTLIHDFPITESVVFWIIMGGAGILGGIAGAIINKLGLANSYRLGIFVLAASLFVLTLPYQAAIYFSAVLFGISFIFMTGLIIVWGTRQFPDSPFIGVSIAFFSLGIGQSIGSIIAGLLIEGTSYPFAFIVFSIVGALFIFCNVTTLTSKS